jgi:predicted phosphoribosyltransferase
MGAAGHLFSDRRAAGIELAREVQRHGLEPPVLVLGLPRGGVPIAAEVAQALQAPLDVMIVRKVGAPTQPELAIGAVASGNLLVREPHAVFELPEALFQQLAAREREELERREHLYRAGKAPLELVGRTVVLADDGLATGSTMLAAVRAARQASARAVIVAAPVASPQAVSLIAREADAVIVPCTPLSLHSIGEWYEDFRQLDDDTVCRLLEERGHAPSADCPRT